MIRITITVVFLMSFLVTESQAQLFQRLRGNRCVGGVCYPSGHKVAIPAYVDGGGDTIVINNSYPAPIAPQASTIYGYGYDGAGQYNLSSHFSLDPNKLMREAARLTEGAQSLHSQALTGFQSSADQLSKAALDNQRIALASQMLDQLGIGDALPPSGIQQIQSSSFNSSSRTPDRASISAMPPGACIRICPDGQGGLKIMYDDGSVAAPDTQQQPQPTLPDFSSAPTLFAAKCATCHGADSERPFVDLEGNLAISGQQRDAMVAAINSGQMPPPAQGGTLSDSEQTILTEWLNSLQ